MIAISEQHFSPSLGRRNAVDDHTTYKHIRNVHSVERGEQIKPELGCGGLLHLEKPEAIEVKHSPKYTSTSGCSRISPCNQVATCRKDVLRDNGSWDSYCIDYVSGTDIPLPRSTFRKAGIYSSAGN